MTELLVKVAGYREKIVNLEFRTWERRSNPLLELFDRQLDGFGFLARRLADLILLLRGERDPEGL